MVGLPTSRCECTLFAGVLVLMLASCEGRPLPAGDDGVGFGEGEWGDGDGDGEAGDGDGDGDGDGGVAEGGSVECVPVVDALLITDDTPPEAVECVEQVLGDLTVGPTTQLVDLSLLSSLREVGGTADVFGNLLLTSLDGLEQLESVDWLHIRRNPNLSDLHGLDSLAWVDRVTVTNNAGMTSVAGLPGGLSPSLLEIGDNDLLPSLDGLPQFLNPALDPGDEGLHVELEDNPALVDLGGLSSCCSSQAISLLIEGNAGLVDLDGLEGFVRLDSLQLYDNFALQDLDGLDNLLELQTLDIQYDHCTPGKQASLVDLSGAPSLVDVDVLQIQWVGSLTSLAGLEGVDSLSKLVVRNNAALPWAQVDALVTQAGPDVLDACGGVDGPECADEPCPMF